MRTGFGVAEKLGLCRAEAPGGFCIILKAIQGNGQ